MLWHNNFVKAKFVKRVIANDKSPSHSISEILARFFVFSIPTIEISLHYQY